ncbi:MAG TPA: hypothetical protein VMG38_22665 [Trebonia sp.]|nr:hypothetical protein [Trebonia sp.]
MAEWWSIEVFSGDKLPASAWRLAYEDALTEAAVTNGALYWDWHDSQYGVVFEVCFASDEQWSAFRALTSVKSALDAVPDPVNGLLVYRGRGGAAGARDPRKPRPAPSAAALELDEPEEERWITRRARKAARSLRYSTGGAQEIRRLAEDPVEDPGQPVPPAEPARPPAG